MRKESNFGGNFLFSKMLRFELIVRIFLNVSPMAGNSKSVFRGSDNQVRDFIMVSN